MNPIRIENNSVENIRNKALSDNNGIIETPSKIDFSFSVNDFVNENQLEEKIERIYNSSVYQSLQNNGYAFDVSTVTQFVPEVLVKRFFTYGKDLEGKDITLDRLLPIDSSGIGAYLSDFRRPIMQPIVNTDRNIGLSQFGMTSSRSGTSDIEFDYISHKNFAMEYDVNYSINEINQAQYSRMKINIVAEKEKATAMAMSLAVRDNVLGGNDTFNNGDLNGLFNIYGTVEDTSIIASDPSDPSFSQEDFVAFVAKLVALKNDPVRQTLLKGLDTMVVPMDIASRLSAFPMVFAPSSSSATGLVGMSRYDYLKNALKGVEFIETHFGSKSSINSINPHTGSLYKWLFYSKDSDVMQVYMPVAPMITGYATANNFQFQTKLLTQFTGVWLYRTNGFVSFTHP